MNKHEKRRLAQKKHLAKKRRRRHKRPGHKMVKSIRELKRGKRVASEMVRTAEALGITPDEAVEQLKTEMGLE